MANTDAHAEEEMARTLEQRLAGLLERWYQDAAKPSLGTDYDTGQYDALMVCISELHAAIMGRR